MDAAHTQRVLHRDIKPANVLLAKDRHGGLHPYLADFGLSKLIAEGGGVTRAGEVVGTADYLAPEQIQRGEIDERTDLYALGCLAYFCLTGTPPFRRQTVPSTMWAHLHEEPPRLGDDLAAAHPALQNVLELAVAKDSKDRFVSGAAFANAMAQAVGVGADPHRSTEPADVPESVRPTQPAPVRNGSDTFVAGVEYEDSVEHRVLSTERTVQREDRAARTVADDKDPSDPLTVAEETEFDEIEPGSVEPAPESDPPEGTGPSAPFRSRKGLALIVALALLGLGGGIYLTAFDNPDEAQGLAGVGTKEVERLSFAKITSATFSAGRLDSRRRVAWKDRARKLVRNASELQGCYRCSTSCVTSCPAGQKGSQEVKPVRIRGCRRRALRSGERKLNRAAATPLPDIPAEPGDSATPAPETFVPAEPEAPITPSPPADGSNGGGTQESQPGNSGVPPTWGL